jgi:uncharacterized protein (TIGR02145 family)
LILNFVFILILVNMQKLRFFFITIVLFIGILSGGCKKEEPIITSPSVSTKAVTSLTATEATVGGEVLSDGGAAVTDRGIYFSAYDNPESTGMQIQIGEGTGEFSTILTDLTPGTRYYIKAYAINNKGTGLGSQVTFLTDKTLPVVTTTAAINITDTTAVVGGTVSSDGGDIVSEHGIYYGEGENPETTGTKIQIGSGTGAFSVKLTGLTKGTIYFVKAYAVNSKGKALGELKSFTAATPAPLETFTDSRDGNVYTYVQIGTQIWMAENLKYLPSVSPGSEGSYTEAYYYVYGYQGNDTAAAKETDNYKIYGVLYNWTAAMNGHAASNASPSGVQGVCPDGWHLPSDEELNIVENYLGGWYESAGGKMKSTGIIEDETGLWKWPNTGATNESRFSGLPGGKRDYASDFDDIGNNGYWNTTHEEESIYTYALDLENYSSSSYSYVGTKQEGFSVRCVKD